MCPIDAINKPTLGRVHLPHPLVKLEIYDQGEWDGIGIVTRSFIKEPQNPMLR